MDNQANCRKLNDSSFPTSDNPTNPLRQINKPAVQKVDSRLVTHLTMNRVNIHIFCKVLPIHIDCQHTMRLPPLSYSTANSAPADNTEAVLFPTTLENPAQAPGEVLLPAVFKSKSHTEEQPDLPTGYRFPGRKSPVYQSAPCRWQREAGAFVATFWHCECICSLSKKAFTAKYRKWCKKYSYNFTEDKALDIHASAYIC